MRCFTRGGSGNGSRKSISSPSAAAAAAIGSELEDRNQNQICHSPSASSARTSLNSGANSPNLTINLRREYTLAVQTDSYNEIWSKIHQDHHSSETLQSFSSPTADLIDSVLQPDRSSIQEALTSARCTPLTRLVSQYLDSSERTSHLFLSLRRSVDRARSVYAPIADLLDILSHDQLSQSQCDWAFDTFQEFDKVDNPFPAGETGSSFDGIRCCFVELKQQLDSRLVDARRRQRFLRCATRSCAYCLLASAAAAAVAGLVIAAHAAVTIAAAGPAAFCCGDLLAKQRRRLREHMAQVDAAARETYVLHNNLDTIERLVARLHETVESDKGLVQLVLERGRGKGQRHPIQEVVRHLRKNHSSFMHQLRDLDEHIVLCLAAVNRARSLLIQQIYC